MWAGGPAGGQRPFYCTGRTGRVLDMMAGAVPFHIVQVFPMDPSSHTPPPPSPQWPASALLPSTLQTLAYTLHSTAWVLPCAFQTGSFLSLDDFFPYVAIFEHLAFRYHLLRSHPSVYPKLSLILSKRTHSLPFLYSAPLPYLVYFLHSIDHY